MGRMNLGRLAPPSGFPAILGDLPSVVNGIRARCRPAPSFPSAEGPAALPSRSGLKGRELARLDRRAGRTYVPAMRTAPASAQIANPPPPSSLARVLTRLCLILALFGSCISTGCAFMDRDNRRLLGFLDEQVQNTWVADTNAGRIAAAPVAVPVGVVAFALDVVVIQPVVSVRPAAVDTYDLLWKPRGMTAFRKAMLFVPVVVATPIVFVSDWAFRSLFIVDGH